MIRGYDVDQVFADFDGGYRELIIRELGIDIPEISATFPAVWGWDKDYLTPKQQAGVWDYIKNTGFWAELDPLPNCRAALALIRQQQEDGDVIYFITNRPGRYAWHFTNDWLVAQGYDNPTVLVASDKGSVSKGLGIEMFVDDKPENCFEVQHACPQAQVFLLDAPYNRDWWWDRSLVRVSSILDPRIMGLQHVV